jgi:hypothetical protein
LEWAPRGGLIELHLFLLDELGWLAADVEYPESGGLLFAALLHGLVLLIEHEVLLGSAGVLLLSSVLMQ